ncbi:MAG TPA: diguanylate cyclase [Cellvibrionaceae bacterium]
MRKLLWALTAILYCTSVSAETNIKVVSRGDGNARYAIAMIELAMQKIGEPYSLDIQEGVLTAARQQQDVAEGNIDIIWAATTNEVEQILLPVRVPLYKGLLGYRVFIIHADNKNLFARVDTFDDLKSYVFGQGRGWPDTDIMRHNGLKVETGTYEGLFLMADGQRFAAFPRGINEPWSEIEALPELELAVDQHVMLVYRMPFYLFVTPTRPELAEMIERGLMLAINDGSFDEQFLNDPMVQMVIERGNIASRKAFDLTNPDLPEATPIDNPDLWFDVSLIQ